MQIVSSRIAGTKGAGNVSELGGWLVISELNRGWLLPTNTSFKYSEWMRGGGTYEYVVTKPKQTYDYNLVKVFSKTV